jgi:hypothetical protein
LAAAKILMCYPALYCSKAVAQINALAHALRKRCVLKDSILCAGVGAITKLT